MKFETPDATHNEVKQHLPTDNLKQNVKTVNQCKQVEPQKDPIKMNAGNVLNMNSNAVTIDQNKMNIHSKKVSSYCEKNKENEQKQNTTNEANDETVLSPTISAHIATAGTNKIEIGRHRRSARIAKRQSFLE